MGFTLPKLIAWHFFPLKGIFLVIDHSYTALMLFWNSSAFLVVFTVWWSRVSSAWRLTLHGKSRRSFIYYKNRIGLSTEPCGTPEVTRHF